MDRKPTYEELEQRIRDLELESAEGNREEALRASGEKFRMIAEQMTDMAYITDEKGTITYVSPASESVFGFTQGEMLNRPFAEFLAEPDIPKAVAAFTAALTTGKTSRDLELNMKRKDGSLIQGELNGAIYRRGEHRGAMGLIRDITDRKQAEERLEQSEKRFRLLAENSKDMIYRMSLPDGHYEYVSPASVEMLGYTPSDIYDVPMLVQKVIHPDWQEYFEKEWAKLVVGNMPPFYEYQILHKSGETKWLYQRNTLVRDDNGNPVAIEGVVTDITDRKRAEEALRESSQDFSALAENAYTGILIALPNGNHVYANMRAAEITGYSVTELTELNMSHLALPDELPVLAERLKRRMAGESVSRHYETRILRKDGKVIPVEVTGAKTVWHGQVAGVFNFLDITERKRVEEALRGSEERFRTICENAPVLIDAFDKNGRCILWNRECEKLFGWTMDEINSHAEPFALLYPDLIGRRKAFDRVTHKPDKTFRESHPVAEDGRDLKTLWANFQLPDGAIINIGYDVTERKRTEEELRKHRDMLGELVKERTADLQIKTSALEEVNVALKVLLRQVEEDRKLLEQRFLSNINKLVLPYLEKIKKGSLDERLRSYLGIMENNLSEITSPFMHNVQQLNLTPRETQVASLIKDGKTTKEIAEIIGIAPSAVNAHRNNMRSKLNLNNKKVNLRTYLQSLR